MFTEKMKQHEILTNVIYLLDCRNLISYKKKINNSIFKMLNYKARSPN